MPVDDIRADLPLPRERRELYGQLAAEAALTQAARSGRMHHAWLLGGPVGIGKATLAYRFARFLLSAPEERGPGSNELAVDPGSPSSRLIAAGSHPDLLVLERPMGDGEKTPKTIPVDSVRRVLSFFGSTAANGGYRVCIIDSIDELNLAGANALLKTVEEPPERAIVLLISHAPQRVLPTIRSRCRRLMLAPLDRSDIVRAVRSLGGQFQAADEALLRRAAQAADGSVRRAIDLLDTKRLGLLDEVDALLSALPRPPMKRVLALAERLGDRKREDEFALTIEVVNRWVATRMAAGLHRGASRLAPLADVCEKAAEKAGAVETYNLDRRPFILWLFGDLAAAVEAGA